MSLPILVYTMQLLRIQIDVSLSYIGIGRSPDNNTIMKIKVN